MSIDPLKCWSGQKSRKIFTLILVTCQKVECTSWVKSLDCCCTAALIYQCSDADAFLMHLQITAEAPQSPSCHLFYPLIRNFPNSKLGYKGWRQKEMFLKERVLNCSCQIIIFSFALKLSSHEAKVEITKTRMDFLSTPFASISMGLQPLCEEVEDILHIGNQQDIASWVSNGL